MAVCRDSIGMWLHDVLMLILIIVWRLEHGMSACLAFSSQRVVEASHILTLIFPGRRDESRMGYTPACKRMIYFFLCSKDS